MRVGVIAEDDSDVDILIELTCKVRRRSEFSIRRRIGHGSGRLRKKCSAWAVNLVQGGCERLVVLHDLDEGNEKELRAVLEQKMAGCGARHQIILIPIREIEAWLLCDPQALASVFGMHRLPKIKFHPERIMRPKETLRDIVMRYSHKRYVSAIHNKRIAAAAELSKVNRCSSFRPYPVFIGGENRRRPK